MAGEVSQSPVQPEGTDVRSVANQIEGLLDDSGHINPTGRDSRALDPDSYDDPGEAAEQSRQRDEKGRFVKKSAKASETSDDDDTTEQLDDDAEDDQVAEGDDQTEDTDTGDTDDDLATSADEQTDADSEDTDDPIETLAELAEAIEFPVEDMKDALTHTFRAAGEEVTVTLSELEKGYQRDADYRRGTAENAEHKRIVEAEYAKQMQQYQDQHQFLATHFNAMEQMLTMKLNDPQLAALRDSNTAEWNARRTEIGEEIGSVQHARAQAMQQYDQFVQQQKMELKQRQTQLLMDKIPGFDSTDANVVRTTMESLGFNTDEIKEVFDHRLVVGVMELANLRDEVEGLRQEKANAKDAVRRVKKNVPKLQKPGKQVSQSKQRKTIHRDQLAKAKARAKKSGNLHDAATVIEQMNII